MTNKYGNITATSAVVLSKFGDNAKIHISSKDNIGVDLRSLSEEISALKDYIRCVENISNDERDMILGALTEAKLSAKDGDGSSVISNIRKLGKLGLKFIDKISAPLLVEIVKKYII